MPNAPVSVGKYQIVELVGEGAMGNVYRALDPVINRSVAIKVMSDAIARDGALRDRFMREAQAAGSLQHPNVVTIYDFGEVEGHLYIAMEYVEGIDLEQLIEDNAPVSLSESLGIAIDVLLGLSYAHKRGVVHRDIKPANIRITEEGRAKIMDFGVAHLESAKLTATGMMVGTPYYMAPEQITGDKVGPATDIFAVGSVLYELLSHRKAFYADSLHNVLFKVVSEEPPPLESVAPQAPRALDAVLRKAMAKGAGARYQTAQEMANDLTAIRATLGTAEISSLSLGATITARTAERLAAKAQDLPRRRSAMARGVATAAAIVVVAGAMWAYTALRQKAPAVGIAPVTPHSVSADTSSSKTTPPVTSAPASNAAAEPGRITRRADTTVRPPSRGIAPRSEQRAAIVNPARDSVQAASSSVTPPPRAPDSAPPRVTPTVSAPVIVPPPVAVTPPSRPEPEAPSATTEITTLVAQYARAIEARDLGGIKSLYPLISAAQERGFRDFFDNVRTLKVTLVLGGLAVDANSATAPITGAYDYLDRSGKVQHQALAIRATFRRDGSAWRITSVR